MAHTPCAKVYMEEKRKTSSRRGRGSGRTRVARGGVLQTCQGIRAHSLKLEQTYWTQISG
eukprot:1448092-Amphidinium_carterae.1